ncbi:MAG: 3-hydroxyacyl-ACP dehydratase FabZ [Pseudolabrys sp.]|nr:3-hydroxyacyl-ACP dehydratase FabZ [Pseudolabrys sp.]MBV9955310.1 3-hydroxyacyl-ACP dehydratase FabZ [Pseudolabrys sp.]
MNGAGKTLESVDIRTILKSLPHRYPFLMIDRIVEIDGEQSAIGIKNCTINEPHFLGHFPENPVMPGVLLLEGMAQTGGVLCVLASPEKASAVVYFMTIDEAKFRKPVMPGDTVEYHMHLLRKRRNMWWYRAEAKVRGEIVAEAVLSAMMGEPR